MLVNLKDLSCFPVSVSTLISDGAAMEQPAAEEEEDEEDGEGDLPDVNITPDEDVDE